MERGDLEQWKAREVARLLALVEAERRYYQEIAASIPVGLLVLSSDLGIVSANRAVRSIFGLTGSPLRARLDNLLPGWVLERVGQVLKSGTPQSNIMVSDPKSTQRLRIGILPVHSWDDESSPEVIVSVEDFTGVDVVGVPVPSSSQQSLLQDQIVQAERVQAVEKLAARMAHDLNNMLMIATGHSEELLEALPANSPLRGDVQEILNATERMSGLTSHLLAFTRRQNTPSSAIDLRSVLSVVERRLDFEFNISTQPNVVRADAERLEQVLVSLMERERPVAVEISRATLGQVEYSAINITLAGRAFDPEAKSNWFEAVLPAKDTTDEWPSAVTRAYGVIRQWGGDISASSAPGGGTLLRVLLENVPDVIEKKPAPSAAAPKPESPTETILVVEDETGIRELVLKILRRHGYNALEAANGEEALAIFRQHQGTIDLLLTDVMMPRMGGPELVDRLRKQGLNPAVIYVSGYTDDPNIYAGKFPPGTAFLDKPFTLPALLAKVREVLKARR